MRPGAGHSNEERIRHTKSYTSRVVEAGVDTSWLVNFALLSIPSREEWSLLDILNRNEPEPLTLKVSRTGSGAPHAQSVQEGFRSTVLFHNKAKVTVNMDAEAAEPPMRRGRAQDNVTVARHFVL